MNFAAKLPEDILLLRCKHIFFVSIKGAGMAPLAVLLHQAGIAISGADVPETFVTDELLRTSGIVVQDFSQAKLPADTDLVIYSGANQGEKHALVHEARSLGIPTLSHAQALGLLTQEKETIAVCGVGGKSTTSALLSWILESANKKPSFAVGVGTIPDIGTSGRWQADSKWFVVEGDEYVADPQTDITPRFLYFSPHDVICTSLSFDHPDVYASFDDTKHAFQAFFAKLPSSGWLIYNGDDEDLTTLVRSLQRDRCLSVGEKPENQVQLTQWSVVNGVGHVQLHAPGLPMDGWQLQTKIPGYHNLRNAAYAAVLLAQLGLSEAEVTAPIAAFSSTPRRWQYLGETAAGARCYDDYAHHPRELRAALQTLESWFPGKQYSLAFQPHTFSRTKALLAEFVEALSRSRGPVLLLPIFSSARESFDPSISTRDIARLLQDHGVDARVSSPEELVQWVNQLQADHVFVTLGAGDIYKVYNHATLH